MKESAADGAEQAPSARSPIDAGEISLDAAPVYQTELAQLETENARLQQLVRDLQSEVSILNVRRTPAPGINPDRAPLPQPPQQLLNELLGNPETVGLAMDWIKADQANRYASLIALTGLPAEAKEQLRAILAERYASRLDMAAAGLDDVTREQRLQIDGEFRARMETLVGPELTAMFEKAEGKPISFARMQRLDEAFRFEATALSAEQYLPLWNLISAEIKYRSGPFDPEALMRDRLDSTHRIVEGVSEFLDPDQLAVLTASFDREIAVARAQTYSMLRAMRAQQQQPATAPTSP